MTYFVSLQGKKIKKMQNKTRKKNYYYIYIYSKIKNYIYANNNYLNFFKVRHKV